jgi:catechol 2,3-dioxygenase
MLLQTDTAHGPLRPGITTLVVRDLDTVSRYYETVIGLHVLNREGDIAHLGAGGRTLLILRKRHVDIEPRGFAGLFHTAFLMPTRADLGRWLQGAIRAKVPFDGASDHNVSEALYLSDPEGNGIEVYADRAREDWHWTDDIVTMTTEPLDVQNLVAAGGDIDTAAPARAPAGLSIGHVHLRVGGIPEAEQFYRDTLGLAVTARRSGATFYSTGRYHHHIATNIWQSRNAPKRSGSTTGLASFDLVARESSAFDAAAERLLAAGAKRVGDTIEAADPWDNRIVLRPA